MAVDTWWPSTAEGAAGAPQQIPGQPGLHSKMLSQKTKTKPSRGTSEQGDRIMDQWDWTQSSAISLPSYHQLICNKSLLTTQQGKTISATNGVRKSRDLYVKNEGGPSLYHVWKLTCQKFKTEGTDGRGGETNRIKTKIVPSPHNKCIYYVLQTYQERKKF